MPHRRSIPAIGPRSAAAFLFAALVFAPAAPAQFASEEALEQQSVRVFQQMKSQIPISRDPRATRIVECVAFELVNVLDDTWKAKAWEVVLFDVPSVNAFAMPGGKIGVHTGIFKVARNQHALAAVIGHEIAHVTEEHAVKRANRQGLTDLAVGVATAVIGGGALTQSAVGSLLDLGADIGLNRPYGRDQESEADEEGIELMARAGFHPKAAIDLWKKMAEEGATNPPEILSTHPSNETRIDALVEGLAPALRTYADAIEAGRYPDCN